MPQRPTLFFAATESLKIAGAGFFTRKTKMLFCDNPTSWLSSLYIFLLIHSPWPLSILALKRFSRLRWMSQNLKEHQLRLIERFAGLLLPKMI